jgi:uncharacterized membrane protein YozB (DUF420 family)
VSALWLPHFNASLNLIIFFLVGAGYLAIRRGDRVLHPRLMKTAIGFGMVFVVGYIAQVLLVGHARFPGEDWVRSLFVVILLTHTALAVTLVPMLVRAVYLAMKGRLEEHRRFAPYAMGIWLYVSSTGVVIYWMNNWLRPAI